MTYFIEISTYPLQFLFVLFCAVWRSVENQCVTRFRGNGLLMRVMRAGGYFNHRNINSRQEYYHFLNQNIAALLNAGGTFSEKIFFDLDWITPILRGVMIWMIVMMTIAKLMSVLSKRMEFFWQYFQLLCFSVTRTTLTLCKSLFSLNLSMQHCPLCFLLVYMPNLDSNVFLAKYIPSVFFHDMKRREHIS